MRESELPALETAYSEYRPLFYNALSKLVGQGYVVAPLESGDLIHDFLIERYRSLQEHYDPKKGSANAYVYVSFLRYARRQVLKHAHRREREVAPDQLSRIAQLASLDEPSEPSHAGDVADALSRVPYEERMILRSYLFNSSERETARTHGLSRYQVHRALARGLGHFAMQIGRPRSISKRDWELTCLILDQGETPKRAAVKVELPPDRARETHRRNLRLLLHRLLHNEEPSEPKQSDKNQPNQHIKTMDIPALLKKALTGDFETVLPQLKKRRGEIAAYLKDRGDEINIDPTEVDQERVAKLYAVLADQELFSEEEAALIDPFVEGIETEERDIGAAMEFLFTAIPQPLEAEHWFSTAEEIPEEHLESLRKSPDVQNSPEEMRPLLRFGITPLAIFNSMESVSDLIDRAHRYGNIDENAVSFNIDRDDNSFEVITESISEEMFILEAARASKISEHNSKLIILWLLRLSEHRPYLFKEYITETNLHGHVELISDKSNNADLYSRFAPNKKLV